MGTSGRQEIISKQAKEMPGPGNYEAKHSNNVPSFTFHPRPEPVQRDFSPGPGAYDSDSSIVRDQARGFKMNSSKRGDIVRKEARDMPGPGGYDNLSRTIQNNDARKVTIGERTKEVQHN